MAFVIKGLTPAYASNRFSGSFITSTNIKSSDVDVSTLQFADLPSENVLGTNSSGIVIAGSGGGSLLSVTRTLTNAEMLAAPNTLYEIGSTPAAGTFYLMSHGIITTNYVTPYTNSFGNTLVKLGTTTIFTDQNGLIVTAASNSYLITPTTYSSTQSGSPFSYSTADQLGAGNAANTTTITIYYTVVTI